MFFIAFKINVCYNELEVNEMKHWFRLGISILGSSLIIFISKLPLDKKLILFEKYGRLIWGACVVIAFFTIAFFLYTSVCSFINFSKRQKSNYKRYITLENIPAEFENIYEKIYKNYIYPSKHMKKQAKIRTIICISLSIFLVGSILANINTIPGAFLFAGISSLASFFISINLMRKNKEGRSYAEIYKSEIVPEVIKLINNQLTYNPKSEGRFELRREYMEANFDKKVFTSFYNDDQIEGYLEPEVFAKMSDLHICNITKNGDNINIEEVFQGMFAITSCNKNIGTYIKISKNKLKISDRNNRVEMDSGEFEEYFDVYSEDKNLVMRLLTHDIMDFLVDFYKKYNLDFEIVFKKNNIYLRFFTGPMFEPKLFGSSMDKQMLFTYYCVLKFIVEITKKVNLTLQDIEI